MSKKCEVCGKRPQVGHNVSHSNRKTHRRFEPNLQLSTMNGSKQRVCTQCLRTACKTK